MLQRFSQFFLFTWSCIVSADFGTDLRLSGHPPADQPIVKRKIYAFRAVHKILKYFI